MLEQTAALHFAYVLLAAIILWSLWMWLLPPGSGE